MNIKKLKELVDEYHFRIIGGLIGVVVIMLAGLVMLSRSNDQPQPSSQTAFNSHESSKSNGAAKSVNSANTSRSQRTFIDVEGAVKHPGVYQFTDNMRIADAINLASGLNRSADRKHVDLARKLSDQQTVYIPVKGEIKTQPGSANNTGSSGDSGATDNGKVNLNQANQNQLQSINGIGEKRAEKILDYRKGHGNFHQIDDLKKISGIGDKFLDNIKSKVTV